MKVGVIVLFIGILTFECSEKSIDTEIEIGKVLPKEAKVIDENFAFMYEPNLSKPAKLILYNNIEYVICFENDQKVKAVLTYDKRFLSPENYRVGTPYSKIKDKVRQLIVPGYGCHIEFVSGWTGIIINDSVLVNRVIPDTSRIVSFYKDDFGGWASKYQHK